VSFKLGREPGHKSTLLLATRAPDRGEGQLDGMAVPLFIVDFPEHETVALSTLEIGEPTAKMPTAAPSIAARLSVNGAKAKCQQQLPRSLHG
jgi:hypothetical protein